MISHQHRCIFVHIPRTGGSSIEDVIWPSPRQAEDLWMGFVSAHGNKYQTGGLQHLLARQIQQEVGNAIFDSYFKFSIVRNPWDRAVSQFFLTRQRADLRDLLGVAPDTPFRAYLELAEVHSHVQWHRQVDFLRNEGGEWIVDFVGRFERLAHDAQIVFERLGLQTQRLPHRNASRRRPYREYYDLESRQRIERLYKEDIDAFGYEF